MKAAPTVWLQTVPQDAASVRTPRPQRRAVTMTASFRRKLILSLASSLAALVLVTGGVGIQRKLETFRTPGIALRGPQNRVAVAQVDPAIHSGLERGDRLLLIGGDTVRRVSTALEALRVNPSTEIVVQRGDEIVTVSYVRPQLEIDWSYLVLAVIGGLYLLIGLYTILREQSRQSLLFYLWCAASSAFFILTASPTDQLLADETGKALYVVEELARLLVPPLTLHFFLTFPVELHQRGWTRRLVPFLYLPAAILAALQWDLIANDGSVSARLAARAPSWPKSVLRLDRADLALFASFALIAGLVLLYRLLVGERREAQAPAAVDRAGDGRRLRPVRRALPHSLVAGPRGGAGDRDARGAAARAGAADLRLRHPALPAVGHLGHRARRRDLRSHHPLRPRRLLGPAHAGRVRRAGVARPAARPAVGRRRCSSSAACWYRRDRAIGTALERLQYRAKFGQRRNLAQLGRELLHERDLERLSASSWSTSRKRSRSTARTSTCSTRTRRWCRCAVPKAPAQAAARPLRSRVLAGGPSRAPGRHAARREQPRGERSSTSRATATPSR